MTKPKSKPKRIRIDALLVERGIAETLEQARSWIMAGIVYSDTKRLDKPGQEVAHSAPVEVKGKRSHPWVSRGGIKLAHALEYFQINPKGLVAADIGSSTGGFTDVLLHHGAAKVYAVDVGYSELAWKLRQDVRVVVLERTNARYLTPKEIPDALHLVVCDASFIGLQTVLPAAMALAAPGATLVALIKPQFEVEKSLVGEGGIITDSAVHAEVCERINAWISGLPGWNVLGITESPIKGMEGNTEFLIGATFNGYA